MARADLHSGPWISGWSEPTRWVGLGLTLALLVSFQATTIAAHARTYPMRNVEGKVISVSHQTGEGNLDLVYARLRPADNSDAIELLLAPPGVCDQIGFEIETGDRIRARIFLDEESTFRVQKIQNLSRGTMVRLRTLHETPLWSASGRWQGGPMRASPGPHRRQGNRGEGGPPR